MSSKLPDAGNPGKLPAEPAGESLPNKPDKPPDTPYDPASHASNRQNNAPLWRPPRISLSIAAKYSAKHSAPIKLEQVSDGLMPNLEECLTELAVAVGISLDNERQATNLINALVADVYVNAYSDKKSFIGNISLPGGFTLDKAEIQRVISKRCGNNYRRFARSFATTVIEVLTLNYSFFIELLRKRADECNVTPEEAIYIFDGAEGALIGRAAEIRLASIKKYKLERSDNITASNGTSFGSAVSIAVDDVQDNTPPNQQL